MATKNLNISIQVGLKQFEASLGKLRGGLNLVKSSLRATFRTAVVAGFFGFIRSFSMMLTGVQNKLVSMTSEFATLNMAAIKTAAIASKGGAEFSSSFEQASKMARELSLQVGTTALQIQEGLFTAAQAGLNLADSISVSKSALQLATVGAEDFQATLNNLIGIQRAFGVSVGEISAFGDALTGAMVTSKATLGDVFEGLRNVASISSTAFGETRDSFLDATAALMVLNDAGIEGAQAGTKLRAAMQKLMGGTAQTAVAFTKYGVNLYSADAASQKYLGTLLKGQRAMSGAQEEVNRLKNAQYELMISGKENTAEYESISEAVSKANSHLQELESGTDDVYKQFTLSGGKLKPFLEIMEDIKDKAPTEVIGRAFGIRGGEAIMRLLNNVDKFKRFKGVLEEYTEASDAGKSLTSDIFGKFMESVLIKWQKMQNSLTAIFSVIADAFFSAMGPVLDPLLEGLKSIYTMVEENKGIFAQMFEGIASVIKPIFAQLNEGIKEIAKKFQDVFTPGKAVELPVFTFNSETGAIDTVDRTYGGTGNEKDKPSAFKFDLGFGTGDKKDPMVDKMKGLVESFSSLFTAVLRKALFALTPVFTSLGSIMAPAFAAAMMAQTQLWATIGTALGGSIFAGFFKAFMAALPQIADSLNNMLSTLGVPEFLRFPSGETINQRKNETSEERDERVNLDKSKNLVTQVSSIIGGIAGAIGGTMAGVGPLVGGAAGASLVGYAAHVGQEKWRTSKESSSTTVSEQSGNGAFAWQVLPPKQEESKPIRKTPKMIVDGIDVSKFDVTALNTAANSVNTGGDKQLRALGLLVDALPEINRKGQKALNMVEAMQRTLAQQNSRGK